MFDIFYVYAYLDADHKPYYVGKGCKHRAYARNHNVEVPPKERIVLWHQDLDELTAYDLEKFYINLFGRKDINTGILENKTDGGFGSYGQNYTHTPERRRIMSQKATRRKHSPETKAKMAAAKRGVKRDPTIFARIVETRRAKGIKPMLGKKHSEATKLKISNTKKLKHGF